jgi:hypothetical protein
MIRHRELLELKIRIIVFVYYVLFYLIQALYLDEHNKSHAVKTRLLCQSFSSETEMVLWEKC